MLNAQLHPVFQQALGEFASAALSAAVIRQMPARSSVAVAKESDVPTCDRCGFDLLGGCKCPEEGYCTAHGEVECLKCHRAERYRMHEEERGAIEAEEAMAEVRG